MQTHQPAPDDTLEEVLSAPPAIHGVELGSAAWEAGRLTALDRYDVLDTPPEEAFDRITRLTRKLVHTPIALVSFIDGHRQWYKSCEGLLATEVPRGESFCRRTIAQANTVIVTDATTDSRFADNPSVTGPPHVRAYLGIPLRTRDGHNIGTLCAIDLKPREFDASQIELMADLAAMVIDELELRQLADRDGLTGALSRRAFKEQADRVTALALRHNQPLAFLTFDVDKFKSVNDRHGHNSGDRALEMVVAACRDHLRHTDLIGRLGGDEFGVLLPNTNLAGGLDVAEKLRSAIEGRTLSVDAERIPITITLGVSALDPVTRDLDLLMKHADAALYEAKAAGRNRSAAWRNPHARPPIQGRRVLKAGQVIFNGRTSIIDCTVRTLSDAGAGIDVYTSLGIPNEFTLSIKADEFAKDCRVLSRTVRHIDIAFK